MAGDRPAALDMLEACYKEAGMLSPWAALVWVAYQVPTVLVHRSAVLVLVLVHRSTVLVFVLVHC